MPLLECWQFFSDPRNLEKITPPALQFQVRTALPEKIYRGMMIHYTIRPLAGIRMRWLTEITQIEEPDYFVDEQRAGPYRLWHHEHFFHAVDERHTQVHDLVHYVPPLGFLGAIINAVAIRGQLARIFDYREQQLARLVPAAPADSFA